MDKSRALHAIIGQLEQMQAEGVTHVSVSDTTLKGLAASLRPPLPPAEAIPRYHDLPAPQVVVIPHTAETKSKALETVALQLMVAPGCLKTTTPDKLIFGSGNPQADVFVVGSAPDDADIQARKPFSGPEGQLLVKMLGAMGLSREVVYLAYVCCWKSKAPTDSEFQYTLPFLKAQVEVVKPKVIVVFGPAALAGLLGLPQARVSLAQHKSTPMELGGVPVRATLPLSELLASTDIKVKRSVWEDLLLVMADASLPISEKQRAYFT